ncbi:MAG: prolipoprotein diacylglyceryl transferase family protein [Bdellovibrionota bacterium]
MYPILLQIGDFILASWHVFFVLGAFAAWFALQAIRSVVAPELSASLIDRIFVLLYLTGYFGARIFSIVTEDNIQSIAEFFTQLVSFGAMTLYGGIIAVAVVLIVFARQKQLTILRLATLFGAPGLIAIGVGRIGCFLNGDDFGKAISDPSHPPAWAVRFPNLDDGIYRYPVQLYEAAMGIVIGLLLLLYLKKAKTHLSIAGDISVVTYTVGRFVLEYYRGDERGQFLGTSLSMSQGISLVLLSTWVVYRIKGQSRLKVNQ